VVPSARRGLHDQVVDLLGRRVATGYYAEGHTFNLQSLCDELGVSITVVRESIRVLASKGLVDARQRRGTYVRNRRDWRVLDGDVMAWRLADHILTTDIADMRAIIEPAAAKRAAVRRTNHHLKQLAVALEEMRRGRGTAAAEQADLAFHRTLLRATGNAFLAGIDTMLKPVLLSHNGSGYARDNADDPVPVHRAVLHAVEARDSTAAEQAMRNLLAMAEREHRLALAQRHGGITRTRCPTKGKRFPN
jgi:DNA-binding FadR family transcriptional regulator